MAFRLNDAALVQFVYHAIPRADVPLVVGALPTLYLPALLRHLGTFLDEADATAVEGHAMASTLTKQTKGNVNPHLALHLHWVVAIGRSHGAHIREHFNEHEAPWRGLRKTIAFWANALTKMYFFFYLLTTMLQRDLIRGYQLRRYTILAGVHRHHPTAHWEI